MLTPRCSGGTSRPSRATTSAPMRISPARRALQPGDAAQRRGLAAAARARAGRRTRPPRRGTRRRRPRRRRRIAPPGRGRRDRPSHIARARRTRNTKRPEHDADRQDHGLDQPDHRRLRHVAVIEIVPRQHRQHDVVRRRQQDRGADLADREDEHHDPGREQRRAHQPERDLRRRASDATRRTATTPPRATQSICSSDVSLIR